MRTVHLQASRREINRVIVISRPSSSSILCSEAIMHDAVAVKLVHENMDLVLAENFTEREQFILWVRDQDYDLDTCLELCDVVQFLNEDTSERETEDSCGMVAAEKDFAKLRDLEEKQDSGMAL